MMQIHQHLHSQDVKRWQAAETHSGHQHTAHTEGEQEESSSSGTGRSILDSIMGGEELYESGRLRRSHGVYQDEGVGD